MLLNGIFTFFQMEQQLLNRAIVHGESTQTDVIIANDFIIVQSYRLHYFFVAYQRTMALCSKCCSI